MSYLIRRCQSFIKQFRVFQKGARDQAVTPVKNEGRQMARLHQAGYFVYIAR